MKKILIVEDEEHIATGLRFNLEEEGFECDIVADGEEALQVLIDESRSYDAVVLDIMLPGISGFDVAKKLRSERNFVPILMLTARGSSISLTMPEEPFRERRSWKRCGACTKTRTPARSTTSSSACEGTWKMTRENLRCCRRSAASDTGSMRTDDRSVSARSAFHSQDFQFPLPILAKLKSDHSDLLR
jgi:CheY-like chemotaxis protein